MSRFRLAASLHHRVSARRVGGDHGPKVFNELVDGKPRAASIVPDRQPLALTVGLGMNILKGLGGFLTAEKIPHDSIGGYSVADDASLLSSRFIYQLNVAYQAQSWSSTHFRKVALTDELDLRQQGFINNEGPCGPFNFARFEIEGNDLSP
ncbi:hypothetical protein DevBK_07250 [Devosia sp. BK]|uniref:hypothetical protein n=1 Tax=Devosia sp. BK TaxID=2871706 RepID=UPI002939D854|nr:hypothetical protein [Devosia sp. BK]MDV3251119.1 hypothetical protein [Devosia sp. BK]